MLYHPQCNSSGLRKVCTYVLWGPQVAILQKMRCTVKSMTAIHNILSSPCRLSGRGSWIRGSPGIKVDLLGRVEWSPCRIFHKSIYMPCFLWPQCIFMDPATYVITVVVMCGSHSFRPVYLCILERMDAFYVTFAPISVQKIGRQHSNEVRGLKP